MSAAIRYPPLNPMPIEGRLLAADFDEATVTIALIEARERFEVAGGSVLIVPAEPVYRVAPALAAALEALLADDAIVCVCPPADLETGGRGHAAVCDTAIARTALRAAGRLP